MRDPQSRSMRSLRIAWMVVRLLVFQSLICGIAALLPLVALQQLISRTPSASPVRLFSLAALVIPLCALFALVLPFVSAAAGRVLRWGTPPDADMQISRVERPLLRWVEYMAAIHVVRFFSGGLLRGTPVWTSYLRLSGAKLGKRVYVNSLALSDYNLLEFGDDVVVGADAHVAGHTVERGVVKTARIRIGSRVTIGIASIVDIGVEIEDGCQVAALSYVSKFAKLEGSAVYAGVPVRRVNRTARVGRPDPAPETVPPLDH